MENEVLNQLKDHELPECDLEKLVEESMTDEFEQLSSFDNKEFALALLETCKEYLGVSRADNIDQVSRFLKLFNLPTRMQGKWVPYCAAGLSFAAAKAFCNLSGIKYNQDNAIRVFRSVLLRIKDRFFRPTARCWELKETAINQDRFLVNNAANRKLVKPGYIVLFNFDSDVLPDHVGIVESIDADSVRTVEFNTSSTDDTNGGAVSRRDRAFKTIQGFVKIY
jgi:hypothetical protein